MMIPAWYFVISIEISSVTEYLAGTNDSFEGCFNDTDPPTKPSAVGKCVHVQQCM